MLCRQPDCLLARNRLRLVAAYLTRLDAAGLIDRFIQPMTVLIANPNCLAADYGTSRPRSRYAYGDLESTACPSMLASFQPAWCMIWES